MNAYILNLALIPAQIFLVDTSALVLEDIFSPLMASSVLVSGGSVNKK